MQGLVHYFIIVIHGECKESCKLWHIALNEYDTAVSTLIKNEIVAEVVYRPEPYGNSSQSSHECRQDPYPYHMSVESPCTFSFPT